MHIKRSHKEAQHVQKQQLEAAQTLQAAVTQQKSISFPLTGENKKDRKVKRKSDGTSKQRDPPPRRDCDCLLPSNPHMDTKSHI